MGPGEFFVFTVTLVGAALLALALLTNAYKRRLDFKLRKLELEVRALASGPPQRDERADLFEDRVRMLERIATDRGLDIAHQIEALRDRQLEESLRCRPEKFSPSSSSALSARCRSSG
jgi:hypothetical protein